MDTYDIVKILIAGAGALCIIFGIISIYRGIKADGEVDFSGLIKGKIKTGSAGVFLLFFGTIICLTIIVKGQSIKKYTEVKEDGSSSYKYSEEVLRSDIQKRVNGIQTLLDSESISEEEAIERLIKLIDECE